ncbi:tubulin--tyrosine ligase-like protein 12 [Anneissia japonica]|uniref:tubulin--tyrosine ligase-like protein 12 n=1 Tax=Anneissia japonica TaxID=1529436 RepID=UPI0014257AD0|nr:tubulin--tyrosine ligase-like protein 12 [Anneissia japonica]
MSQGLDGVIYEGFEDGSEAFRSFVECHYAQLMSNEISSYLWRKLHHKLENEVYDAGDVFMLTHVNDDDTENGEGDDDCTDLKLCGGSGGLRVVVSKEEGLEELDHNGVYLVDHAWTYRKKTARKNLEQIPGLLDRMISLMDIVPTENKDSNIEMVLEEMWKFNLTYCLANKEASGEEREPIWYIMDEFGTRIRHSEEPTCRIVPFHYAPTGMMFTLLILTKSLDYGDEVTRDYIPHQKNKMLRPFSLLPWKHQDFTSIDPTTRVVLSKELLKAVCNEKQPRVFAQEETASVKLPPKNVYKVYTDSEHIFLYLKDPKFEIVEDRNEADILWLDSTIKDFNDPVEKGQFVNQFPCESLITNKDMLTYVAVRSTQQPYGPDWIPVTFDSNLTLPQFVSYFQTKEKEGKPNYYICKAYNFARGLDSHITAIINCIIRQTELLPKVICEYIHDPVLFYRSDVGHVKFDFRYMPLFISAKPLSLFVHEDFYVRFSNRPYSLDHFDVYEKHFTTMNYDDEVKLHHLPWQNFIKEWDEQYPKFPWADIQKEVLQLIKEFFQSAVTGEEYDAIGHCPYSRSMYALDLMLSWQTNDKGERYMQPQLLECNFCPDCHRACQYRPSYFDSVFRALFLNETENQPVIKIA